MPATASADPAAPAPAPPINANECNDAFCTPGITAGLELGAPCGDTGYDAFGVDTRNNWGRLLFCGLPRRADQAALLPLAAMVVGVKEFNSNCSGYESYVAQAPDGLFLSCAPQNGESIWVRGDA